MSDPHDREPIDQAAIDRWRVDYGLDKRTPADAARYWGDTFNGMAPAGAVAALGIALDDLDALRKDAERWRKLRDTPATSVAPGPMRGWLFMRPGSAESMDRMADELPAAD